MTEQSTVEVQTTIAKWIKPPILFVKLKSDGSCIGGHCSGGGVIRDGLGRFIMAFSNPLGQGTSDWAEAWALMFGLTGALNNDIILSLQKLIPYCFRTVLMVSGQHHGD